MAKYTGADLIVEFDNSSGASLQNMTQYVTDINGINIEAVLEETHTFGDAWVEALFAGLKKVGDITISGFYDDAATTGPDVIFNAIGNTVLRRLKITWGSTKTSTVSTIIKSYNRTPSRGAITKFSVTLTATGAVTEA